MITVNAQIWFPEYDCILITPLNLIRFVNYGLSRLTIFLFIPFFDKNGGSVVNASKVPNLTSRHCFMDSRVVSLLQA